MFFTKIKELFFFVLTNKCVQFFFHKRDCHSWSKIGTKQNVEESPEALLAVSCSFPEEFLQLKARQSISSSICHTLAASSRKCKTVGYSKNCWLTK